MKLETRYQTCQSTASMGFATMAPNLVVCVDNPNSGTKLCVRDFWIELEKSFLDMPICHGLNSSLIIAAVSCFWAKNGDFRPKLSVFGRFLARFDQKNQIFGQKSSFLAQKYNATAIVRLLLNPWHMGMFRKLFSSSIQKSRTHNFVPLLRLSTQAIKK